MNKHGFTLLELLTVVAIIAIVGVGASLSFANIESDTAEEELTNTYISMQKAASLYLDLHNSDLEWFIQNKKIYYKVGSLMSENYIEQDIENPVTHEPIDSNLYIELYIDESIGEVGSCIIDRSDADKCIANSMGLPEKCCE